MLETLGPKHSDLQIRTLHILFNTLLFNANQMFMELIRVKKGYEDVVSVARDSLNRLQMIEKLVKEQPEEIDQTILKFVEDARGPLLCQGAYALMRTIAEEIRTDKYDRKPFKELQKDLVSLAEFEIEESQKQLKAEGLKRLEMFEYFKDFAEIEWVPFAVEK